jgi:hypothetical protein
MSSRPDSGTISFVFHNVWRNAMQVTALAEALADSRRPDGAILLPDLEDRLSRAGLEEFARAAVSLARRAKVRRKDGLDPNPRVWF